MRRNQVLLYVLVVLSAIFVDYPALAQALKTPGVNEVAIGNPTVSLFGDDIAVEYDLLLGDNIQSCNIQLQVSVDGGNFFNAISEGLKGDLGFVSSSGKKMIVIPMSLYGRGFKDRMLAFDLQVVDKKLLPFDLNLAKDLAAEGSANCYIVSQPGLFSFPMVKGNSSESLNSVSSVEVLWESNGTEVVPKEGDFIYDLICRSGRVYFNIPFLFSSGNVLVAAKDVTGKVLWSWHLWITDQEVESVKLDDGKEMMARNLGSLANRQNSLAYGLLYQWGRKDPFLGAVSMNTVVESTGTFSVAESTPETGTVDYTIQNPMTFLTSTDDWCFKGDDTLWQTDKTIYDPCPPGWRVPDSECIDLSECMVASSGAIKVYKANDATIMSWFPATGYRKGKNAKMTDVTRVGGYWSVAPDITRTYYFEYHSGTSITTNTYKTSRSTGMTVRCVKE